MGREPAKTLPEVGMEAIIAKRLAKVEYMSSPQASVDDPPPPSVETVIATDSAVLEKRRHFYLIGKHYAPVSTTPNTILSTTA